MCGIVGLFLKDLSQQDLIGVWFETMLVAMTERGPDSAGFAIYKDGDADGVKYSLYNENQSESLWDQFETSYVKKYQSSPQIQQKGRYKILKHKNDDEGFESWCNESFPGIRVMGYGKELEIYKDVGSPESVSNRYDIASMSGKCMIGHTRMATESAVNVEGCHPFTAGLDLCLVHNGSFANHNSIRRELLRDDIPFDSWNDTEVSARFLQWGLRKEYSLKSMCHQIMNSFSGFFTLTIGLPDQFAILRDPYACKPMVVAETETYVACASEYRALAHLPDVAKADTFEPSPGEVYTWSR